MADAPVPNILGQPSDTITCECGCVVKVTGLPPLSTAACPKCERTFPVTVRLGQFLLLKRLGHGAMGEVFEAKDITLGRHVAIKVLSHKVAADEDAMRNFVREARNLAALNHRNVVQVHTIGVEKGQPYIVMELVPGGRVDQMVLKDAPGDERRLLEIMIDASRGLEAASGAGLIHGDVKPANILIDNHGQAKIVDFGLARFEESQAGGKIYGTPYYLPPELLEGKTADFRSDMYSLGASFFHALTGRPPFKAKTVKDIVRMRLIDPAPNVRTLVPTMHPKTGEVVAKMLEKSPDDRYASYSELVAALQEAIREFDAGPVDPALVELHEALSGTDRSASRSGRVQRPDVEAAGRSRSNMRGQRGKQIHDDDQAKSKLPLILAIAGGVIVLIIILVIVLGGGGGSDGPKGGGSKYASFTDTFDAPTLDAAWQFVDGGGNLMAGHYQIQDRDPSKNPGIKRILGLAPCTIDIDISKIEWPDSDGSVQIEFWDDGAEGSAALFVHLWKAQGRAYIEMKAGTSSLGGKQLGKTQFDSPPTAIKLRATWFDQTQRWKITYGLNGAPADEEASGSPASDPSISVATPGRYMIIRAEQYGTAPPLSFDLSEVSVQYEEAAK